ncbi:ROK family protein [Halapricum sp. CBA1109]|uniref:ROK family protein n=1 Tax=Halapricum sp. CBA1109 TaxID=2668068 RepID=UPI0012FA06F4|nr:ROK family protein [Halapricum sp. CBA1109]MUV89597.1 ROK family protein [Halapricum sp. CBA1109]
MATYAGVDLGGTYVRAIVGTEAGVERGSHKQETPQGPTGIAVTEAVLETLRAACDDAGVDPTVLRGVGIGSIGPLDLAEGAVENPANLPDSIDRIPLTGPISNLVESEQVYLHNDTIAGVIGERFHNDRNPDDMAYLTISTGIGAGVCVDGHVLSGWDGNAGEVGHMTIDPAGTMECGCGKPGHWEAYCSGQNIPKYARRLYEDGDWETDLPVESEGFSAVDIYDNAGEDAFADHVIEKLNVWNSMGMANIIHSYAPLVVYVGGGVALNNPELVLEPIRERIEDRVFINIPEIKLTTLGDDVVLKGALASAMTEGTGDRARLDS